LDKFNLHVGRWESMGIGMVVVLGFWNCT
jgi:hypothetical protein